MNRRKKKTDTMRRFDLDAFLTKAILIVTVFTLMMLLSSCGLRDDSGSSDDSNYDDDWEYVMGQSAIVIEDTTMTNCFYYELKDEKAGPAAGLEWKNSSPKTNGLSKADLVVVLEEGANQSIVCFPFNSDGLLYGTVDTDLLKKSRLWIEYSREAVVFHADVLKAANGEVEQADVSGNILVLEREGDWSHIQTTSGGQDVEGWVPNDALIHDLDGEYIYK